MTLSVQMQREPFAQMMKWFVAIAVKLKCWRKLGVNQQIVVQTSADPANWFNQALSGLTLESEGCFHFKPCTLFNCPSCQVQL